MLGRDSGYFSRSPATHNSTLFKDLSRSFLGYPIGLTTPLLIVTLNYHFQLEGFGLASLAICGFMTNWWATIPWIHCLVSKSSSDVRR
jgi:hypothetical protein